MKACATESGTSPFVTVTGEPTTAAVPPHEDPRKYRYVTVPPAWYPPRRVAESLDEPPTVMVVTESRVEIVGFAFATARGSHEPAAGLLFESPE